MNATTQAGLSVLRSRKAALIGREVRLHFIGDALFTKGAGQIS